MMTAAQALGGNGKAAAPQGWRGPRQGAAPVVAPAAIAAAQPKRSFWSKLAFWRR